MAKHVWKRQRNDKVTVHIYACKGCGRSMKIRAGFDNIETMAQWLKYPVECPRPVPTPKDLKALWEIARQWVTTHQVRGPESVDQVDSVNLACPALASDVAGLVGFYEDDIE
jgi:hypothetical protein